MTMSSESGYRLLFGLIILLIVNVLKIAPNYLNDYLSNGEKMVELKPLLLAYIHSCSFVMFIVGICFSKVWIDFCLQRMSIFWRSTQDTHTYSALQQNEEDASSYEVDQNSSVGVVLGESSWVPLTINSSENPSEFSGNEDDESDDGKVQLKRTKVRFSRLAEIRHLSDNPDAVKARLSYVQTMRLEAEMLRDTEKLPPTQMIVLAAKFGCLWFSCCLTKQLARQHMNEIVFLSVFSTSSCLFVTVLSSLISSGPSRADAFSLTKVVAVLIAATSVASISSTHWDVQSEPPYTKASLSWALLSAFLFSLQITLLRHYVKNEDCLDVPIFLGVTGLLSLLSLWPLIVLAHLTKLEKLTEVPSTSLLYTLLTGLFSTDSAELLWVWSCLMTSSLLTALSTTLAVPMLIVFEFGLNGATTATKPPAFFYSGSLILVLIVLLVAYLTKSDRDPISVGLLHLVRCLLRRRSNSQIHALQPDIMFRVSEISS